MESNQKALKVARDISIHKEGSISLIPVIGKFETPAFKIDVFPN